VKKTAGFQGTNQDTLARISAAQVLILVRFLMGTHNAGVEVRRGNCPAGAVAARRLSTLYYGIF
jgi:hypothetical protein